MATFLDLVKDAYAIAGLQGEVYSVNDSGLSGVLASKVSKAWVDIQQDETKDFTFRQDLIQFTIPAGRFAIQPQEVFGSAVDQFGQFKKVYLDGRPVPEYDDLIEFKLKYEGTTPSRLTHCCLVDPDILYVNLLAQDTVVKIKYRKSTQVLTDDEDVVRLNPGYHSTIIYKALVDFAYVPLGDANLQAEAEAGLRTAYTSLCQKYNKKKVMSSSYYIL